MSEYQYYEFQAIDRRLSDKEMQELRSHSTRAQITPTSFVNEYSFGSFKGNEDAWMDKYFDAFLYVANWGTHLFKLRLPSKLLSLDTARQFCSGDPISVREKSGNLIFTFVSEEEAGGDWIEGGGLLASLLPIRDEIARGDLRALYLGWLLCIQDGNVDEKNLEPPVPANLGQLSGSLSSLAEFLRLDPDLLAVAAQTSPTTRPRVDTNDEALARWLTSLPSEEKDRLLLEAMQGKNASVGMELWSRFHRQGSVGRSQPPRRTAGELIAAASAFAEKRRREGARKTAQQKVRRDREAAIEREKYLDSIASRTVELWGQVEQLIATRQSKSYDLAVEHLMDLRDLAARQGTKSDFADRMAALRQVHARKPGVITRLNEKGL